MLRLDQRGGQGTLLQAIECLEKISTRLKRLEQSISKQVFKLISFFDRNFKLGLRRPSEARQLPIAAGLSSKGRQRVRPMFAISGEELPAGFFSGNLRRLPCLHKLVSQIAISRPLIGAGEFGDLNNRVERFKAAAD